jgi:Ran GTPase-activating protein (RanGAP) involved in mRNA processing and transport
MQVKEMLYEIQCLISYNQRLHNIEVESCGVKDDLAKLFGIGMFQNK